MKKTKANTKKTKAETKKPTAEESTEPLATEQQTDETLTLETPLSPINECVDHAREVIATQLGRVKAKGYDFAPEFRDMTTQLYLFGVMWKYAEGLEGVTDARETAFSAMETMLISDRVPQKKVPKRIEFLRKMSKVEDGSNALAVAIGYDSQLDDNSLVEVFDHYIDVVQVSGAFWRLYDRCKKTMLYGGLFVAFVVIWFVTLFMPGNSAIAILAAGLISAAIFVIPVFLVGLWIYHSKIKKAESK
ncbi:MAG: hypothetical protein OEX11_10285 [Nitrosomonas sp.]|nr:hypothetical protein [Nitrosomonas sp.]